MARLTKDQWAELEQLYRTGRYSLRALAEKFETKESTIRSRRDRYGWKQDLSDRVLAATNEKLSREGAPEDATDDQVVEAVAQTCAEIVLAHRADIREQRELVNLVVKRLKEQLHKDHLIIGVKGEQLKIDLPLDYLGKVLANVTQSLERLVKLERQAFKLDEESESDTGKTLQELVAEVSQAE